MSSESENLPEEEEQSVSLLRNTTNMEAQAEHEKAKRYKTLYAVVTFIGVHIIILTYLWLDNYLGGFSLSLPKTEFNWHPLLMVTGMLFLYSQSILVYRTGRNKPKFQVKCIHAGLHITILILASLGLKAAFDSHNNATPPIPNLYTLHSWLGIMTFTLFCFQLILGFGAFLYPGASKNLRTALLPYHVIIGSSGFVMAVVTACMGLTEKVIFSLGTNYQERPFAGTLLNLIGLLVVVFGVLTIHLVNHNDYKREEIMEDEVALSE